MPILLEYNTKITFSATTAVVPVSKGMATNHSLLLVRIFLQIDNFHLMQLDRRHYPCQLDKNAIVANVTHFKIKYCNVW